MYIKYNSTKKWEKVDWLALSHEDYANAVKHKDDIKIFEIIKMWTISNGVSKDAFTFLEFYVTLKKILFNEDEKIPEINLSGEDGSDFKLSIEYYTEVDLTMFTLYKLVGESNVKITKK